MLDVSQKRALSIALLVGVFLIPDLCISENNPQTHQSNIEKTAANVSSPVVSSKGIDTKEVHQPESKKMLGNAIYLTIWEWTRDFFSDKVAVVTLALVIVVILQLKSMQSQENTIKRQMRAYVVGEGGYIGNVTNPPPGLQIPGPNPAAIAFPAQGPIARISIKNTGQTPAFRVIHWGNSCFREFPLASPLPPKPPNMRPLNSILGPGIISTKNFNIPNPLTPQEIARLRAGTGAIYVYGEILYRDAFGKEHFTRYRLMHHLISGTLGISTDLTFCEEGNEADEGDSSPFTGLSLPFWGRYPPS
jgi:hypothetical protein